MNRSPHSSFVRCWLLALGMFALTGCVNVHVHFPEMPKDAGSTTEPADKAP
jgi:hypothetical protein